MNAEQVIKLDKLNHQLLTESDINTIYNTAEWGNELEWHYDIAVDKKYKDLVFERFSNGTFKMRSHHRVKKQQYLTSVHMFRMLLSYKKIVDDKNERIDEQNERIATQNKSIQRLKNNIKKRDELDQSVSKLPQCQEFDKPLKYIRHFI